MTFPISGVDISPLYLVGIGFAVGILGGFFGVGGSFLAGPALFMAGMPMNYVVGTDLAHIVGKSIVAAKKHHAMGNVDKRLGVIMVLGTITGVEAGAQCIQYLKKGPNLDIVVAVSFIIVQVAISAFIAWESVKSLKIHKQIEGRPKKQDTSAIAHLSKRLHWFHLPPMISLPASGIEQISLWVVLGVAFVGGMFSGFFGGGAGYIRMPSMVFILGVPTHVAVGTDLFEIMISASYGTLTHAVKGNVDILVALTMHTGAAIGAQIGVMLTEHFHGPGIRLAFVPLPLIGAAMLIYSLLTGQHLR